jgi:hypothetical protein
LRILAHQFFPFTAHELFGFTAHESFVRQDAQKEVPHYGAPNSNYGD